MKSIDATAQKVIEDNISCRAQMPHLHLHFELINVLRGHMILHIDNRREQIGAGESALIFPNQMHSVEATDYECQTVSFAQTVVISFYANFKAFHPESSRVTLSAPLLELLGHLQEEPNYHHRKGLMYLVCSAFNRDRSYRPRNSTADSLSAKIILYIEENYLSGCTIKDIADDIGYDEDYLALVFKRATGMSIRKYINILRLEKACYLLESSRFGILRCAEESGFACVRSFNRNFKAHFGITPAEHRKLYQTSAEVAGAVPTGKC